MNNMSDEDFVERVVKQSALYKRAMALKRVATDSNSKHFASQRFEKNPSEITDAEARIDYLTHHTEPLPKE